MLDLSKQKNEEKYKQFEKVFDKKIEEQINLKSDTLHLSENIKFMKYTTIYLQLTHPLNKSSKIWVPETYLAPNFTYTNWKLKQTFPTNLQTSNLKTSKTWLLFKLNYPLSHQANLIILISHTPTNWNWSFSKPLKNQHMDHSSANTFPNDSIRWHSN